MKLSIITICKNEFPFIIDTCESIVKQTFQDFEWIVIDGGSTDGSLDIFNKYNDKINFFTSIKSPGIYKSMNTGIENANGEFIIFMNGGDMFYNNNVFKML